ncbi:MAG: response regulator [Lachnospiraceae bacterium]|nr:response regulator [Lachnospiraceae bacterium]
MGIYEGSLPWEHAKGRCILIAEDNEINAEIMTIQLEDFGLKVDLAGNGQEAVDKFMGSAENEYALVIMDIMMPVMDGHEATEHIRNSGRLDSNLPIIAITANTFDAEEIISSGEMNSCITKPYNKRELYQAIIELIGE